MTPDDKWNFHIWLDVAVRVYGLTPQEFWAVSVADWLSLLSSAPRRKIARPLKAEQLSELMHRFPDLE